MSRITNGTITFEQFQQYAPRLLTLLVDSIELQEDVKPTQDTFEVHPYGQDQVIIYRRKPTKLNGPCTEYAYKNQTFVDIFTTTLREEWQRFTSSDFISATRLLIDLGYTQGVIIHHIDQIEGWINRYQTTENGTQDVEVLSTFRIANPMRAESCKEMLREWSSLQSVLAEAQTPRESENDFDLNLL